MATAAPRPKLLAIVGPTASGKTALAIKVARKFNGEIICADSRTVYKAMDIGTAKPTKKEQAQVKHWGLDLIEPGQRFTAYQFKKYAQKAIKDIQKRGKLPILVGGSGLYIDAVLFDFGFLAGTDLKTRQKLEALSLAQLQQLIVSKGYKLPQNSKNRRHLIRTIETKGQKATRKSNVDKSILLVGIQVPTSELKKRIDKRVDDWFLGDILDEVKNLRRRYGQNFLKTAGIGYQACCKLLHGEVNEDQAKDVFKKEHWQYARRQATWFRRNPFIQWFGSKEEVYKAIERQLNT